MPSPVPEGEWAGFKWEFKENTWWEIMHKGVGICIEPRPGYCDRGRWIAKIFEPGLLYLDSSDGWPRYYFNLERAKHEIEDFLHMRAGRTEI